MSEPRVVLVNALSSHVKKIGSASEVFDIKPVMEAGLRSAMGCV